MNIISITDKNYIQKTTEVLKAGGLVIFPSDTVYGLLVDATNETAVKKLIQFKNRPPGKAISIFVADKAMMDIYVYIDKHQKLLLDSLLPGPFTFILSSKRKVSPLLESERKTLGVRLPDYHPVRELVKSFGRAVTATSANLGGRSPHYSVETLLHELPQYKKELVDLIVDGGKLPRNKPSTVVDLTTSDLKIVRKGDIVSNDNRKFMSESPTQTKKIAKYIYQSYLQSHQNKPLVVLISGNLGAGKTVFVKGVAEIFGINTIISPTYVIYYEYEISKNKIFNKFYHFDLYQIENSEEFKFLGIEKILEKNNFICMEWGERAGDIIELIKNKATIISIELKYIDLKQRAITLSI